MTDKEGIENYDPHPAPQPTPASKPGPTEPMTPTPEPLPEQTLPLVIENNNSTLRSTKNSKLPVVATFALAITGVDIKVTIAVHLEMLAVKVLVQLVVSNCCCNYIPL